MLVVTPQVWPLPALTDSNFSPPETATGLVWTGVKDTGKGGAMSLVGYENLTRPKSYHLREAI